MARQLWIEMGSPRLGDGFCFELLGSDWRKDISLEW
jgi:hypothetical protein